MSTIGAYLEGRQDLFAGLAIESLEKPWTAYPVQRLDLNAENYTNAAGLEAILESHLTQWERIHGSPGDSSLSRRFLSLIQRIHENTGQRVVVLVDEYDKPAGTNWAFPMMKSVTGSCTSCFRTMCMAKRPRPVSM